MSKMLTGEAHPGEQATMPDDLTTMIEQASIDGALGGSTAPADRPDSTETLQSVDVPVLALVGIEDPVYPVAISQQMVDAAQDGTLAVIDGASHAAVFENPNDSAQAILDFLSAD
ncbi:alpha/beta fold hydrolase [Palleronia abyssalis]|uniref:2-succinyl-6-hydroxy-2, 4-cyclohexadiene-1-carboxylate synthase n=1 Tax=Palleronia abyssalis TaxID=1501240 RepID=A0A2R8BRM3_9RHOB|nr:alpha/beta hydrolase [Palleronia abyssalis]SPJ22745.1 2-succinyl-6-hydroxy-2, 4-cyclohexadiene-1-carboxylate synthase [Palleronia abyssalis]